MSGGAGTPPTTIAGSPAAPIADPAPGTAGSTAAGADAAAGSGGTSGAAAGQGGAGAGGAAAGGAGAGASAGSSGSGGSGGLDAGSGTSGSGGGGSAADPISFAEGLHELFMHDACTGVEPSQPDTCLHEQEVEQTVTFGGDEGEVYAVTLRVRGLFEPTTISGGQVPMSEHPYFKVGGNVAAVDWSHWHIEVSDPPQTYWLNHYPSTSHIIHQEDFEATLEIAAGAEVAVRVIDGNDRQMDNAEEGLADRRQLIEGVTDEVLDGQMLRLDVISVEAQ